MGKEVPLNTSPSSPSTVPDWLYRRGQTHRDMLAVVSDAVEWTYGELLQHSGRVAAHLINCGLQADDRVAVLVKQAHLFAMAMHGVMQAGGVLVPVNSRLSPIEIAWQLADAGATMLLFDEEFAKLAMSVSGLAVTDFTRHDVAMLMSVTYEPRYREHIELSKTHALIYTSGTTGRPKGAMLTYGNHWWSATSSALQTGILPGDAWLSPMPLFHVGGLQVLLRSVIYGTTAVLLSGFDADVVNQQLDARPIAMMSLVPTMLQRLLDARGSRPFPSHLRFVLLGGSAAPRPLLEMCAKMHVPVAQSYGLTEADSQVTTLAPEDGLRKLGSSGRPLIGTEIAIVAEGKRVAAGEVGEIWVRGPSVSPGYWNRPDATHEAMGDGWLHTGDIGRVDDEGYLYVLDRRTDLIVSGGENIYPAEVETALLAHSDIADAAVVAKVDAEFGHVPVAFVVPRHEQHTTAEELRQYCRSQMAKYKVPKEIHWVAQLPRNASGKLLRKDMRAWLEN